MSGVGKGGIAPPPSPRGLEPRPVDWTVLVRAKRLMRGVGGSRPMDLHEAAMILGVRARDLDLALWRELGAEGW